MRDIIGSNANIDNDVKFGYPGCYAAQHSKYPIVGINCIIKSGTIIYWDVVIGDDFESGHNVIIGKSTLIGDHVFIDSFTSIGGSCMIGDETQIGTGVYIPSEIYISNNVIINPNVTFVNQKPYTDTSIGEYAIIGANSTIEPGIIIGNRSIIHAGTVVTEDVPEHMMAIGNPMLLKEIL